MLKLLIPFNGQKDFFKQINFEHVEEVYAKMPEDFVGGGRSSLTLPDLRKGQFKDYVQELHGRNVRFNYLLNATCLDNLEVTRNGYHEIRKLLDWLVSIKVDAVTLSLPFLVQIVKKHYPSLCVEISTQVRIDCWERAKYWEDLGADVLTLSHVDMNRNFPELQRILKKKQCKVQLIANLICRKSCPYVELHGNFNAHASQAQHVTRGFALDYYCLFCLARIFSNPEEIIKSGWIRPEDVTHYEQMGVERIKLAERGMTTSALSVIVNAYTRRRYEGNFIDLIPTMSKYRYIVERDNRKLIKGFFHPWKINIFKLFEAMKSFNQLKKASDYYEDLGVYIDNKKLDGVVSHFVKHNCALTYCDQCGFCSKAARDMVEIRAGKEALDKSTKNLSKLLDQMVSGDLF